jgi:hypothetical protein
MKQTLIKFTVVGLLGIQMLLLSHCAWVASPTITEISHLGAIKYYWVMGYYDVFHVNPPLTRILAGIPYYMVTGTNDFGNSWSSYSRNPADRCEQAIGNDVLESFGKLSEIRIHVYTMRIFLIPLIILASYIGFKFATELHGTAAAGFTFLLLWVFSPFILGWGATLCTDVPAASVGIIAFYGLWHWFKTPTPCKTVLAGVLLGLLPYTKLTWIIAFPILLALYLLRCKLGNAPAIKKIVWVFVIAIATINVGYWFDGSFKLLKDYQFISGALTGNYGERGEEVIQGNRFAHSILGSIPVPLPYEFVRGIDTQKLDFERGFTSYAAGLTSNHGWWWYYLYCLLLKGRLVVWFLFIEVLVMFYIVRLPGGDEDSCHYRYRLWDDTFIAFPAVAIFVFVSMNTGFSEHSRYIIPMLPFLYLFLARITLLQTARKVAIFVAACAAVNILPTYPYCISHFESPFSDESKIQYLVGSNVDWGQSAYEIKEWCDTHVEARPRYVSYTRSMSFDRMQIKDDGDFPEYQRKPGWMIISANDIHNEKYKWLLKEKPVEILGGGSVFIYYLEPE